MYSFKLTDGPNGGPGPTSIRLNIRERDLERRRSQGEAACAECRRLRLKCDRKLPCSSCTRRGCPSICPNGSLTTGHGSRFVLANTEKLHGKLIQMSERIRQLEDALQIVQTVVSLMPHPLLSKELLMIKNDIDSLEDAEGYVPKPEADAEADVFSEFGTLTISDQGETQFYGRSGSAVYMANTDQDPIHDKKMAIQTRLPTEIVYFTETFPFSPVYIPKDQIRLLIESRLPPYERATALAEAYLQHVSFFFQPVDREQLMEELIPAFYGKRGQPTGENETGAVVHRLALLIAVFACGSMGDLTQEITNEEGELFRQLSRTALSLQSIFEGTSLATVQAVALLGLYEFFSCSSRTLESAWKMQALSFSLASSIGLHWDPSNWGIDMKYVNRRRMLFWEICKVDSLKSLGSGRPSTFRMHEIDCRFPADVETGIARGTLFRGWMYKYIKEIVAPLADKLCSVNAMKYSEIINWDRRIREFTPFCSDESTSECGPETENVLSFLHTVYKEITLLFIHRHLFVRALRENPNDPMQSRFAPSFLTTFSSAIAVLKVIRRECEREHSLLMRQWPMWTHTISAGVVVGSIAANNSPKELASSARSQLDLAISLFDKAPIHPVIRNGLPILLRLREKSRTFVREAAGQKTNAVDPSQTVKAEEIDEALSIIGGVNRIVRRPLRPYEVFLRKSSPPPTTAPNMSFTTSSANGTSDYQSGILSQDLRTRNGQASSSSNNTSTLPLPAEIRSRQDVARTDSFTTALRESGTTPRMVNGDAMSMFTIVSDGRAPFQSSQNLPPSHNLNPQPSSNPTNDLTNHEHGLPIGLPQHLFPASAAGDWDMGWAQIDWDNLNIPTNFDFDIGPPDDIPVEAGDNMIQDAWNYVLQDHHPSKYSDNGGHTFESQLHI